MSQYANRKFLAIEGKELSELVGLVCKTCGKTLNDRYVVKNSNFQSRNDDVIMKLTNERGAEGVKKCYCLPNNEVAKKFFKDVMKRDMKEEVIKINKIKILKLKLKKFYRYSIMVLIFLASFSISMFLF